MNNAQLGDKEEGLAYSSSALDVLTEFHNTPIVLYVEGPNDVPFWNTLLKQFSKSKFTIKPAGGVAEIEKYINSVVGTDSDIYIARDSDFDVMRGMAVTHPRIFYTYGYSIENTLCNTRAISEIISVHGRTTEDYSQEIDKWVTQFCDSFSDLLILEIADQVFLKGIGILGANCHRFLPIAFPCTPKSAEIAAFAKPLMRKFTAAQRNTARALLQAWNRHSRYIIRGHFLFSGIQRFIECKVQSIRDKIRLSYEDLYTKFLGYFNAGHLESNEREFYERQFKTLKSPS